MPPTGAQPAWRWPRRLLISVALGLAITIALTWASAIWAPWTSVKSHQPELAASSWRIDVPDGWTVRTWLELRGPGIEHHFLTEWDKNEWSRMEAQTNVSELPPKPRTMTRFHCGWPFASGVTSSTDDTNTSTRASDWIEFGIPLREVRIFGTTPFREREPRLPLRFIPHLFAANVTFWSAVSLLLLFPFRAIRPALRRRRNLCTACGYPRAGTPTCPECAQPSSPQRGAERPPGFPT